MHSVLGRCAAKVEEFLVVGFSLWANDSTHICSGIPTAHLLLSSRQFAFGDFNI